MNIPETEKIFLSNTALPAREADDLTSIADCLNNVGSLKSHTPICLHGLLRGYISHILRTSITNAIQTRPLVREGAPRKR
jgi:hypothetical protein